MRLRQSRDAVPVGFARAVDDRARQTEVMQFRTDARKVSGERCILEMVVSVEEHQCRCCRANATMRARMFAKPLSRVGLRLAAIPSASKSSGSASMISSGVASS